MLPKEITLYYHDYEKCWMVEFLREDRGFYSDKFYMLSPKRAQTIYEAMIKMSNNGLCELKVEFYDLEHVCFYVEVK